MRGGPGHVGGRCGGPDRRREAARKSANAPGAFKPSMSASGSSPRSRSSASSSAPPGDKEGELLRLNEGCAELLREKNGVPPRVKKTWGMLLMLHHDESGRILIVLWKARHGRFIGSGSWL